MATRFPYDTILSKEDLNRVDLSENEIKKLALKKVRVRVHKDVARIEVEKEDFNEILKNKEKIVNKLIVYGFKYVSLVLDGLKTGNFDK